MDHPALPRRNLWPYGIVAAFGVFVAATVGLIVLSLFNRVDLVTADYYEQELRYQEQIDRRARTELVRNQARIVYEPARQAITIALPLEPAEARAVGTIQLYRPSEAKLDRRVVLELDADGRQTLDARSLARGLWRVRVTWAVNQEEFFLDQDVVITRRGS